MWIYLSFVAHPQWKAKSGPSHAEWCFAIARFQHGEIKSGPERLVGLLQRLEVTKCLSQIFPPTPLSATSYIDRANLRIGKTREEVITIIPIRPRSLLHHLDFSSRGRMW